MARKLPPSTSDFNYNLGNSAQGQELISKVYTYGLIFGADKNIISVLLLWCLKTNLFFYYESCVVLCESVHLVSWICALVKINDIHKKHVPIVKKTPPAHMLKKLPISSTYSRHKQNYLPPNSLHPYCTNRNLHSVAGNWTASAPYHIDLDIVHVYFKRKKYWKGPDCLVHRF